MVGFNHKTAIQSLTFFAQKEGNSINKMKALKLIWLSDRLHLRRFGRTILNDTYFALKLGPIPSNTKDLLDNSDYLSENEKELCKKYIEKIGQYEYKANIDVDFSLFSKTDVNVMSDIFTHFGGYTEFQLSEISHFYPEWKKFEKSLKTGNSSRFLMNYVDFFENPENNNHSIFEIDEELLLLNKEFFLENQIIQNLI